MKGKIDDPKFQAVFDYWKAGFLFKWVFLPPNTPLNILNVFAEPRRGATGELEPIKCFRGYCSSLAARHHTDFARDFLKGLPAEGGVIPTAAIVAWVDERRGVSSQGFAGDAESYLDVLSA